jgi:GNAT superfamily N-acetyltransferase
MEDFLFERLTVTHQIKPFDCNDEDIDLKEFLEEDALPYLKQLLAVTYLIESPKATIAFFTVSNDKILLAESKSKQFWKKHVASNLHFEKRGFNSFPAVKIGRLAVNKNYQSQGFGKMIIDWVKHSFIEHNKTGCLFVIVDALNRPRTISFYQKCGFDFLRQDDLSDKTRLMYYCLLENK